MLDKFMIGLWAAWSAVLMAQICVINGRLQIGLIRQKQSAKRIVRNRKRPVIEVIIYAQNENMALVECLDSIRLNSYKPAHVTIVADHSAYQTRQAINKYRKLHSELAIRIYQPRATIDKASLLKRYASKSKADIVLTIDATEQLPVNCLNQMDSMYRQGKLEEVIIRNQFNRQQTLLDIYATFAQAYRQSTSKSRHGAYYLMTSSPMRPAIIQNLSLRTVFAALAGIGVFSYATWLALIEATYFLYIGVLVLVALRYLVALSAQQRTFRQKFILATALPIVSVAYFAASLIEIVRYGAIRLPFTTRFQFPFNGLRRGGVV